MATQKIVNQLEELLTEYKDGGTLSRHLDKTIRVHTAANEPLVYGPRQYEIPKEDGALAFNRAVLGVLGDKAETTSDTQVMTLETQNILYGTKLAPNFSEYALENFKVIYDADVLEELAKEVGVEVPRDIDRNREKVAKDICAASEIIGIQRGETQAYMGLVNLYKDGKQFGQAMLTEESNNFTLLIRTTHEHDDTVKEIVSKVEEEISKGSIYKGRAYDYSRKRFINDLQFGTADKIVLASDLSDQIRSRTSNRLNNAKRESLDKLIPGKKKSMVITNGEGGTGKTETARALGAWAIKNGRTFLTYMPEKVDIADFQRFLDFANKVGPSFILIEDIEKMVSDDPAQYSLILETLDGISSKSQEIDIWVNSNNANENSEFFKNTFLRRFDVLFDFDQSNAATIQGLFAVYLKDAGNEWELSEEVKYKSDLFEHDPNRVSDEDFVPHEKMSSLIWFAQQYDFKPWAIKQVVETSISYMIDRGESVITEDHLLASAKAVVKLNDLVSNAKGTPSGELTIDQKVASIVETAVSDYAVIQK